MNSNQDKSKSIAPGYSLSRHLASEALGTALLLCAVVGSGIMGEKLSGGNVAIALLANSLATGCALVALILVFAPLSGAHFNPVVTLSVAFSQNISKTFLTILSQFAGALIGVWAAHFMFGLPLIEFSQHAREGWSQWFSEGLATFGLLSVIHGCKRYSTPVMALAVGGYIMAAYWFTSSTSFANPAVTLARAFTDTFAGIRPADVIPFILAQMTGAFLATFLFGWFDKKSSAESPA